MEKKFPILLLDDDPAVLTLLQYAAKHSFPEAYFVYLSSYGEAVDYLDNLRGTAPKLVMLDIDLKSKENGFSFLQRLRVHPQGRLLPVVMLSAYKTPKNVELALELNSTSFMQKPFLFSEWKDYLSALKSYWMETVRLPPVWFG